MGRPGASSTLEMEASCSGIHSKQVVIEAQTMNPPHTPERIFEITELAWIANSFLWAATELTEATVEDPGRDHAHRARVPMYLVHHAIELLYKSALLDAGVAFKGTHSLKELRAACVSNVPDCCFKLPPWLEVETEPEQKTYDLFPPDLLEPAFKLIVGDVHERLRYVTDRKGRKLEPTADVDSQTLHEEISEVQRASLHALIRLTRMT